MAVSDICPDDLTPVPRDMLLVTDAADANNRLRDGSRFEETESTQIEIRVDDESVRSFDVYSLRFATSRLLSGPVELVFETLESNVTTTAVVCCILEIIFILLQNKIILELAELE